MSHSQFKKRLKRNPHSFLVFGGNSPQIENADSLDSSLDKDESTHIVGHVVQLRIDSIIPDPEQPRQHFDEERLSELASSIKENGLLQPITVMATNNPSKPYQLIAGERRWRAHHLAGLTHIDAIVKNELSGIEILQYVENANREDLTPFEEAHAIHHIKQIFQYSNAEIARKVGKSRSRISNILKILPLEPLIHAESVRRRTVSGDQEAFAGERFSLGLLEELSKIIDEPFLIKAINKCFEGISRNNLRNFIDSESEKNSKLTEKAKANFKTQLVSTMGEEERKHMKSTNIKWNTAEKILIKDSSISNDISSLEFLLWAETEQAIMDEHLDLLQRKLNICEKVKSSGIDSPPEFLKMIEKLKNICNAYRYINIDIKYLIDSQSVQKKKIRSSKNSQKTEVGLSQTPTMKTIKLSDRHLAFLQHINEQFRHFEGNFIGDRTFESIAANLTLDKMIEEYNYLPYRQGTKKPAGILVKNWNRLVNGDTVAPPKSTIKNKALMILDPFEWNDIESKNVLELAKETMLLPEPTHSTDILSQIEGSNMYFQEVNTSSQNHLVLYITDEYAGFVEETFNQDGMRKIFLQNNPTGSISFISDQELIDLYKAGT